MSYEKTTWSQGDKITSTKLNKIEQGIYDAQGGGSGVMVVTLTRESDVWTADKTIAEIAEAFAEGMQVNVNIGDTATAPLLAVIEDDGACGVVAGIMVPNIIGMIASAASQVSYAVAMGTNHGGGADDEWTAFTEDSVEFQDAAPFECTGTIGEGEDHHTTITLNKTAAEMYAAQEAGKIIKITAVVDENTTSEFVGPLAFAQKLTSSNTDYYFFAMHVTGGDTYVADDLSSDSQVVFVDQTKYN